MNTGFPRSCREGRCDPRDDERVVFKSKLASPEAIRFEEAISKSAVAIDSISNELQSGIDRFMESKVTREESRGFHT
jgi:hypothetical protein